MYCPYCSNPIPPGVSYCPSCGAPAGAPDQPTVQMRPGPVETPPGQGPRPGSKVSFWKTPGGIITIIFISVFVIGGLTAGLIFAFSGSSGDYSESVQDEWTRLNEIADEIDGKLGPVKNLESIGSAEQVKSFRDLLGEMDGELDDIAGNIKSLSPPDNETEGYNSLLDTVKSYRQYLDKLDNFLAAFTANVNDTKLDTTLEEMIELAGNTRDSGEDFTRSDPDITPSTFDPEVLGLSSDYVTQLAAVRKAKAEKEKEETSQETVEAVNSARNSLENILSIYVREGWSSIVQFMTQSLYTKHEEADPPWDQVSYTVESADITNFQIIDESKIIFTVREQHDEGGDTTTETGNWEMVKSGESWLLNNTPYTYD